MSERLTELRVDLEFPVEHDGKPVDHLTFRRITARDSMTLDKVPGDKRALAMIALIARVPIGVIEALDVDDWEEVLQRALPFMPRSMRRLYEKILEAQGKTLDSIDNLDLNEMLAAIVKDQASAK